MRMLEVAILNIYKCKYIYVKTIISFTLTRGCCIECFSVRGQMLRVHCLSVFGHFDHPPLWSCSILLSRFQFDYEDWKNLCLRPETWDQEGSSMVTYTHPVPKRISAQSHQNGSFSLNMNALLLRELPHVEMVEVKVWTCRGASYPACLWQM